MPSPTGLSLIAAALFATLVFRCRTQVSYPPARQRLEFKEYPPSFLISAFRVCFDVGVDTSPSLCRFVYTLCILIVQLHSKAILAMIDAASWMTDELHDMRSVGTDT